ncbi:hypothetical protein A3Q56_04661 [Intoshia linei]|uniref:Uncharacterized protein n=1 Tax=Intoshia linei TaxID=1819745 RepID=A0A177B1W2_9BILA|nr:hypothetical protein A3Q56_04661 [Intoshia linei]
MKTFIEKMGKSINEKEPDYIDIIKQCNLTLNSCEPRNLMDLCTLYNFIAFSYLKTKMFCKALLFYQFEWKILKQIENFPLIEKIKLFICISYILSIYEQYDNAIDCIDSAIKVYSNTQPMNNSIQSNIELYIFLLIAKADLLCIKSKNLKNLNENENETVKLIVNEALSIYNKCLTIIEYCNDFSMTEYLSNVKIQVAKAYLILNHTKKAKELLNCISIEESCSWYKCMSYKMHDAIGCIEAMNENYEEALVHFTKCVKFVQSDNLNYLLIAYNRIANVYTLMMEWKNSLSFYHEQLKLVTDNYARKMLFLAISRAFFKLNDIDNGEKYKNLFEKIQVTEIDPTLNIPFYFNDDLEIYHSYNFFSLEPTKDTILRRKSMDNIAPVDITRMQVDTATNSITSQESKEDKKSISSWKTSSTMSHIPIKSLRTKIKSASNFFNKKKNMTDIEEDFLDQVYRIQSRRINGQRGTFNSQLRRSKTESRKEDDVEKLFDIVIGAQKYRMNDQRGSFNDLSTSKPYKNVDSARNSNSLLDLDSYFIDIVTRIQGNGFNDQRSELPQNLQNRTSEAFSPSNFFDMVASIQGSRMDDQRATVTNFPGVTKAKILEEMFFKNLIKNQNRRINNQKCSLPINVSNKKYT